MDSARAVEVACSFMETRNYRRAEEVLRSALTHDPHNVALLTELARAQHFLGDNAAAERSARLAMAISPDAAYPMRICAAVVDALGRRREALSLARRAVNAAPHDHTMHYQYAQLLATAGLAEDALAVVTEAVRLAPDNADAHDLRGVILGMLGRRKESTAEHQEALRLDPNHAYALANLAVNKANSRNLPGAIAGFREAGQLDPHIGDEVRKFITMTVRKWFSWMTVAAWAALWISARIEQGNAGATRPAARVVAGIGCIALLVMLAWVARSLPRNLWASVLRQREFRSLKLYLGTAVLVIVVLGACALGAPINYWVLTGAVLITVVVSWIAPRFDKDWLDKVRSEKH